MKQENKFVPALLSNLRKCASCFASGQTISGEELYFMAMSLVNGKMKKMLVSSQRSIGTWQIVIWVEISGKSEEKKVFSHCKFHLITSEIEHLFPCKTFYRLPIFVLRFAVGLMLASRKIHVCLLTSRTYECDLICKEVELSWRSQDEIILDCLGRL